MKDLFAKKKIFGMIHLSGSKPIERALKEIEIYTEEGVHGCIVENYHDDTATVIQVLEELTPLKNQNIMVGINILPNQYELAFDLGDKFGVDFIQLDYVSGQYKRGQIIDQKHFLDARYNHKHIPIVFGGVWPKYYEPIAGSDLEADIAAAIPLCEGIVVTGSGTGKETPLDKIKKFNDILKDRRLLIVGAGVDVTNVKEHLAIADGAIVGSCFKPYKRTQEMIERSLVKEFMNEIKELQ